MKFLKNMKKAKKDNKGFSLVELIIVIAIMAILVGIVGTQVIPYLSKSKVAKDQQILNAISTAAVTAFSENAEDMPTSGTLTFTDIYTASATANPAATVDVSGLVDEIIELTGYNTSGEVAAKFGSCKAADVTSIKVEYDIEGHKVTTSVEYSGSFSGNEIPAVEGTL